MRSISLKEMQDIELQLLLELDRICKKHSLRYYMDGGTLLGAIYYQGFIPWDDDIDIKMPRPDYDALLKLGNELTDYIELDIPSPENCQYAMVKLIDTRTVLTEKNKTTGVYIDILPMDGYPLDESQWGGHLRALGKLNTLFHYSLENFQDLKNSKNLLTKMKGSIYSIIYTPWKLYTKLTNVAKNYDYDIAKYVGLLIEGNPEKERYKKEWLQDGFTLEFEGYQIPAPSGYKEHLEIFYGSHITNPEYDHNLPVIKPDHTHEVYWKD